MTRFIYSPSTRTIYFRTDIKAPDDCIEMPDTVHAALLSGQASGKQWVHDGVGLPILSDPALASLGQRVEAARRARQAAYAAEADPIFFQVQRGEADRADWLAKIEEIKLRIPDPST